MPDIQGKIQHMIPRRVFDKLLERYGMAATFESLYRKYENMAWWNQNKINDLTKQISELKSKVGQFTRFIEAKGLVEAFKEFIKPKEKSVIKNIKEKQRIADTKIGLQIKKPPKRGMVR